MSTTLILAALGGAGVLLTVLLWRVMLMHREVKQLREMGQRRLKIYLDHQAKIDKLMMKARWP